jgi:hypothetical protein
MMEIDSKAHVTTECGTTEYVGYFLAALLVVMIYSIGIPLMILGGLIYHVRRHGLRSDSILLVLMDITLTMGKSFDVLRHCFQLLQFWVQTTLLFLGDFPYFQEVSLCCRVYCSLFSHTKTVDLSACCILDRTWTAFQVQTERLDKSLPIGSSMFSFIYRDFK